MKKVLELLFGQESIDHLEDHIFFFGFEFSNQLYLFHQAFILNGHFIGDVAVKVDQLINGHPPPRCRIVIALWVIFLPRNWEG
ncbi:MAG: hypothetical protein ACXIUQ_02080 [Cecembia sp.]